MIITIDIDKKILQENLELFFIKIFNNFYSWMTTDGEIIGYIVGVYHVLLALSVPILAFVSHTIYPCIWLKLYVFCNLFLVFFQHIFLNVCIMIPMEERLTKHNTIFYPIFETFLSSIKITISDFIRYIIIAEGFTTLCFGLELFSELSKFIYSFYEIYF